MELMLLRVFQRQIQLQCQAVLVGSHEFNSAMTTGDMTHTWIAVQNILAAAANISKALWGQGGKLAKEREPLRATLQVGDTSPLRYVAMRNHFEHYDERLDRWWESSEAHNHLDMSVVSAGAIEGMADIDMFRVFDPSTSDIVFGVSDSTWRRSSRKQQGCFRLRAPKHGSRIGNRPTPRAAGQ